ncbi:MAG: histidinol dehydrogenase [Oscillospiraceae bacterium]
MIDILNGRDVTADAVLLARADEVPDVTRDVAEILEQVRQKGDAALAEYTRKFDGVSIENLKVSGEEVEAALAEVDGAFMDILRQAAENIRDFHQRQVRQGFVVAERPGVVMGQKIRPIERVGVYVPGGTAAYPSTVLMDAIPAKVAGVEKIVMVTPPGKDGRVDAGILAAAHIAGVGEIYKVGGAQAIAALAYGTATVPKVDKIVGPGNLYVATAKKMLYGAVDIDMIAGPSDVLVVADETAKPAQIAADMLAQAEHDANAAAVLVTTSAALAEAVDKELERQLPLLPREQIARASIQKNGRIIVVETIDSALEMANALAPEHLELCVEDPFSLLPQVKNAGSIFLGHNTPEALGDYFAGPNHTLPTGGTARFYSPLSVDDFIKKSSYLYYSKAALAEVSDKVIGFAKKEGLDAHARSVEIRKNE